MSDVSPRVLTRTAVRRRRRARRPRQAQARPQGACGPGRPTVRLARRASAERGGSVAAERLLVVLAGQPLGEPIANHGPFVMSTYEEIEQAFVDYHSGALGR